MAYEVTNSNYDSVNSIIPLLNRILSSKNVKDGVGISRIREILNTIRGLINETEILAIYDFVNLRNNDTILVISMKSKDPNDEGFRIPENALFGRLVIKGRVPHLTYWISRKTGFMSSEETEIKSNDILKLKIFKVLKEI